MQFFCRLVTRILPCLALSLFLAACGCSRQPSIEFTNVPPASEDGGSNKLVTIEGRVRGSHSRQRIVLFAKSGVWWVQPLTQSPYTTIRFWGQWSNSTHLGTDYAALLVDPDYQPPFVIDTLPPLGNGVIAVATVKGASSGDTSTPSKTVHFSNYDWRVRGTHSNRGGQMHSYDPANVWTDDSGFLHLKITKRSNEWVCSEVNLTRSLGYGIYKFTVHDVSQLEPAAALTIYTWSDLGIDQHHREMNFNLSRWGDPENKNAEYVVQPYYIPANIVRYTVPAGPMTYTLQWEPGRASFSTTPGDARNPSAHPIFSHIFDSGVPSPGGEYAYMNFCVFGYGKLQMQQDAEAVVEKFQYLP